MRWNFKMLASGQARREQVETAESEATFLLVDDDFVSILNMRRVLKKLGIANRTVVARDGQEAIDILKGKGAKDQVLHTPCIVILDMNMPRMDGYQFLEAAAADSALKELIVFAFQTARLMPGKRSKELSNIAAFIDKDAPVDTLLEALRSARCGPLLKRVRL